MKFIFLIGFIIINLFAKFEVQSLGDVNISDMFPTIAVKGENTKITIKGEGFNKNTKVSTSGYIAKNEVISNLNFSIMPYSIAKKDNLIILADGVNGVTIIDISNINKPILKSQIKTKDKAVDVKVENNLIYVADSMAGVTIIDIINPSKPILKSNIVTNYETSTIAIRDNTLFVGEGKYLSIYDISTNTLKSRIEVNGVPNKFILKDNLLYCSLSLHIDGVENGEGGLSIIDIKNINEPNLISSIKDEHKGFVHSLILKDNFAILGNSNGISFIDVSNINKPSIKYGVTEFTNNSLSIKDNFIFAINTLYLNVIDISNIDKLSLIETIPVNDYNAYTSIFIKDNFAFIGESPNGISIFDISNPNEPTFKSQLNTINLAKLIEVKDNYAYLIMGKEGFSIIDISNPNEPILKSNINIDFGDNTNPYSITLKDNFLYVSRVYTNEIASILTIIDVSEPLNPIIKFNQKFDFFINDIVIRDNLAFIAKGSRGVDIFDISNPTEPIFQLNLTKVEAYSLKIRDNLLFIGGSGNFDGLNIFDISNPNEPILKSNIIIDELSMINKIVINNDFAYLVDMWGVLAIVNISNLNEPTLQSTLKVTNSININSVEFKDNLLYISTSDNVITIVDVTKAQNPTLKTSASVEVNGVKDYIYSLKIKDNLMYLSTLNGFVINPISNLSTSTIKSNINQFFMVNSIAVKDDLIYINADNQLNIYNLSNLTTAISTLSVSVGVSNINIINNLAFIYSSEKLAIVDVLNPYNPTLKSIIDINGSIYPNSIAIKDNFIFIATENNRVDIWDISNLNNPILKSNISTDGYSESLTIQNDLLFIANGTEGVSIFDISNINKPTLLSNSKITLPTYQNSYVGLLAIKENFIFAVGLLNGYLSVLNISNPNEPILESNLYIGNLARDIKIRDNLAFIANYENGLTIIDISNPKEPIILDILSIIGEGNIYNIDFSTNSLFSANLDGGLFEIEIPTLIESSFVDLNTLQITFPNYTTLGKYNLSVINGNENFSKLNGAITLEEREVVNSISKPKSLELKVIGETKEFYEVGESIELMALYKNVDGSFENMFAKLDRDSYKIVASDESKVSILDNRVTFLKSGEVAIKMQTKTQEGLLKFKVVDENGTFEKEANPIDMIIIVGRDNEKRELEKAFIKNGNDLYLFAITLTDSKNIKYFNSISKEQILADIDENFGKDNVVLQKIVNFDNIKEAIENMPYSTSPLLIHILGHGSSDLGGKVLLEEEYLPAVGLKKVIDDYQNSTNRDVIIVVDACYSGAFANALETKEFNRLIITSVNANETAIMAPLDGTSYSKYLKEYFGLGNTMGVSFDESTKIYRNLSNNSLSPTIKGNEILQNFKVPNPKISSGLSELFLNYTSSDNITLNESKELFVEIKLSEFERKTLIDNAIYAKVIPPQTIDLDVGEFEIPTIEIEKVILKEVSSNSDSVTYKANWTFDKKGIYSIAFAIENNMQNTIETKPIEIKVEDEEKATLFLAIDESEAQNDNFFLKEGWNLIASPIKEGINVKELKDIEAIWSYINGVWKSDINKLEPNRGYWIKATKDSSYKFSGTKYKINFNNLVNGWNLVGTGQRVYKYEFENIENSFLYENGWLKGDSEYFHYLEEAKGIWIKK